MEIFRGFGTIAPGVVALTVFAALGCSSSGDNLSGSTSGDGGTGSGWPVGPSSSSTGASGGSTATGSSSETVGTTSSGDSTSTAGSGGASSTSTAGTGGSATTASVGSGTGGMDAASSGSGGPDGETRSPGCGSTTPPKSGRFSIDVSGTKREYILAVPDNYDPNHAYRLIFAWHPLGGSAEQVATGFGGGYYGLQSRANGSAIFVSAEGIEQGWANTGGRDVAFARAMLERFRAELCIDESRIFSTGFSYGGMMSFALGCAMGDVFRAIAPMSGALYSGCEKGDHPVAMWGFHGDADNVVPLANGRSGRDVFIERNGCSQQTKPIDPSPCVSYEGCDEGYPVVWCEFSGGHSPTNNSGEAIWKFFSQF